VVVGTVVEVVCVSLCDTSVGFPVTGPLGVQVSSGGDVIALVCSLHWSNAAKIVLASSCPKAATNAARISGIFSGGGSHPPLPLFSTASSDAGAPSGLPSGRPSLSGHSQVIPLVASLISPYGLGRLSRRHCFIAPRP